MDEHQDDKWYWLKEKAKNAFMNSSDNYKQKILFNLLNATKTGDQNRFFNILCRAMVANLEDSRELATKISDISFKNKDFEKLSYSIIFGIIVSKNKHGGN